MSWLEVAWIAVAATAGLFCGFVIGAIWTGLREEKRAAREGASSGALRALYAGSAVELAAAEARLAELSRVVGEAIAMRAALLTVEWVDGVNVAGQRQDFCPCCNRYKEERHAKDCELAGALAKTPTAAALGDVVTLTMRLADLEDGAAFDHWDAGWMAVRSAVERVREMAVESLV